MPSKKVKVKKVKAWAVVYEEKKIENEAYFADGGGCCCADEPLSLAVYETKEIAEKSLGSWRHGNMHKIIPCIITYKI